MRTILIALTLLTLQACAALEPYKLQAYEKTKKANDKLLNDALVVACDGATHGAVKRRYPTAQERERFDTFCAQALNRASPSNP